MLRTIWEKRNGRGISGFAVNRGAVNQGAVNRGFTVYGYWRFEGDYCSLFSGAS